MAKREASNAEKKQNGTNTQIALSSLLQKINHQFQNIDILENVEYGEKGKDQKQFKIKHEVIFKNSNLRWLIDETSSFKSDRVKGKEFIMEHTKKILHNRGIDSKAYFIVPDNCSKQTKHDLENFNKHIIDKDRITLFDGALLTSEFNNLLVHKATESMGQGKRSNILGNYGEKYLVETFNNPNNLIIRNYNGNYPAVSTNYRLFKDVLNKLCPTIGKLKSSQAYRGDKNAKDPFSKDLCTIRDANGNTCGHPKTDVIIRLENQQGHNIQLNISVKNPSKEKGEVTIHEGYIEQLLSDLKESLPTNSIFCNHTKFKELSKALLKFQSVGSYKQMKKMDKETQKEESFLENNLSKINKWLIDYFVFGINNKKLKSDQIAKALIIFNPKAGDPEKENKDKQYQILALKDTENIMLAGKKHNFNTPFSWTYPSPKKKRVGNKIIKISQKGKKYQIKGYYNLSLNKQNIKPTLTASEDHHNSQLGLF